MPTKGRPQQVSAQAVESAANRLTAQGSRVTIRGVREALGGIGSLPVIQRHLAAWEADRSRKQASNPFSVSAEDVRALAPADFATLINHLVRLEARKEQLRSAPETTADINLPDGGVDGRIAWNEGPYCTPHLPARTTIWQSKAGSKLPPSDLEREIERSDRSALKEFIAAELTRGGAYVVFSAIDFTADQKRTRVEAMRATVRKHFPDLDPLVKIFGADEIAMWAADDLWSRAFLIRASGREHTSLLATYEEWERSPNLSNPYVWEERTEQIAEAIRLAVQEPAKAYRLNGPSGLGKTRLALEALRPLTADGIGVAYFDAAYEGTGLQLLKTIPDWRRYGVGGVLVVDDCDAELHRQIEQAIAGTSLSVLTLDFHADLSANATMVPVEDDAIEQIIEGFSTAPAPEDVPRIVRYAEGWPLMAMFVLRAIREQRLIISELTDDQVTQRLIGCDEGSQQYEVISLLALFDHIGFSERVSGEWEELRSRFAADIPHDAFHRIVIDLQRRGLVLAIGRYWRLTPTPLAIRLTRRWLERSPEDTRERLFTDLSSRLTESLGQRFGEVTTETSVALSGELLSAHGRFGTFEGMVGTSNAKIVRHLAAVNPAAGSAALTRALCGLSDQQLLEIADNQGRQSIVWSLEAIAFHRKHFAAAALLLYSLARNENATHSNNSSGTLTKFFAVYGSQTEAPPEDRLALYDRMIAQSDVRSAELVARAARRALSIGSTSVMVGVESQGGRPRLIEWHAKIYKEIFDYYRGIVDGLLKLSAQSPEAFELARDAFADGIPCLVRYQRFEDLERGIFTLRGRAWPKAVDRVKWSLRGSLTDDQLELRARVEPLLKVLVPEDFAEQVKLFVSKPARDVDRTENGVVDRTLENVERFARECLESGRVREAFAILSTGAEHRLPHAFGQAIAKFDENRDDIVDAALDAFANAPEPRNDLLIMSIIGYYGERDDAYRHSVLEKIAADGRLISALPAAAIWPRTDAMAIDLLIAAFEADRLKEPPRAILFMGNAYAEVSDRQLRLLATIFVDRKWYSAVVGLLTFGTTERTGFDDIFKRVILDSSFIAQPMDDMHEWSLFEKAKGLIRGDINFAESVFDQMAGLAISESSHFGERRRVAELWPILIIHDRVWERFKMLYGQLDRHNRWRLLIATQHDTISLAEDRLAIEGRSIGELVAFGNEYIDDVPVFLGQYATMIDNTGGVLKITPLMLALLENFGNQTDVLHSIDANVHSFLSVGPRADYYEQRMALVDEIPDFGSSKIEVWKSELHARLEAERKRASLRDAEGEKGIF